MSRSLVLVALASFLSAVAQAQTQCPLINPSFKDVHTSVLSLANALAAYSPTKACENLKAQAQQISTRLRTASYELRKFAYERSDWLDSKDKKTSPSSLQQYHMNPNHYSGIAEDINRVTILLQTNCGDSVEQRYPIFSALTQTINGLSPYLINYGGPAGSAVSGANTLLQSLVYVVGTILIAKEPRVMRDSQERNVFINSACSYYEMHKTYQQLLFLPDTIHTTQKEISALKELITKIKNDDPRSLDDFTKLQKDLQSIDRVMKIVTDQNSYMNSKFPEKPAPESMDYTNYIKQRDALECRIIGQKSNDSAEILGSQLKKEGEKLAELFQTMKELTNSAANQGRVRNQDIFNQPTTADWANQLIALGKGLERVSPDIHVCAENFRVWRNNFLPLGLLVSEQLDAIGYLRSSNPGEQKVFTEALVGANQRLKLAEGKLAQLQSYIQKDGKKELVELYYGTGISEISHSFSSLTESMFLNRSSAFSLVASPSTQWLILKLIESQKELDEIARDGYATNEALQRLTSNEGDQDSNQRDCYTIRKAKARWVTSLAHLNSFDVFCKLFAPIAEDSGYRDFARFCFASDAKIGLTENQKNAQALRREHDSFKSLLPVIDQHLEKACQTL